MSSAYTPYADVYTQPHDRPGDDYVYTRGRSQADPDALVRQRQWDEYTRPPAPHIDDDGYTRRRPRNSSAPDGDTYYYERDRRHGRNHSRDSSASSSRSRSRSRTRRPRRSSHSQRRRRPQSQVDKAHRTYDGDVRSRVGRAFDASPNGVLAAAAGAGFGAITARRFGDRDHFARSDGSDKWKTIGGALVGGLAANAAENKWRKYSEEKDRSSEARIQRQR